jgi:hypothetical protein
MGREVDRHILEIRTYKLIAGQRTAFDREMRRALPMLGRHGIRVVRFGPSLADDDHYILMRAYDSLEQRIEQVGGFYSSEEWARKHAPAVDPLLETYHTVLLEVEPAVIDALTVTTATA